MSSPVKTSLRNMPSTVPVMQQPVVVPVAPVAPLVPAPSPLPNMVGGYYAPNVGRPSSMGRATVNVRKTGGNHVVAYILWFIIVFLIAWILLYAFGPSFVVTDDEVDQGKVILWSIVIAFLVVAIVSIVYTGNRGGAKFTLNLNA